MRSLFWTIAILTFLLGWFVSAHFCNLLWVDIYAGLALIAAALSLVLPIIFPMQSKAEPKRTLADKYLRAAKDYLISYYGKDRTSNDDVISLANLLKDQQVLDWEMGLEEALCEATPQETL